MLINSSTPPRITPAINALCLRITPEPNPVFLTVTPVGVAEPLECFMNVSRHVQQAGGSIQYGWLIWEWPTIMVEAEFHAVWVTPQGEFSDITPKGFGVRQVLFLPDPSSRYEGYQVDNIRHPLRDNPQSAEFIETCQQYYAVMNKDERKYQHSEVSVLRTEIEPILQRRVELKMELNSSQPETSSFQTSGRLVIPGRTNAVTAYRTTGFRWISV